MGDNRSKSLALAFLITINLACTARAGRHFSARTTLATIQPYSARVRADYCAEKAYDLDRRNRAYRSWRDAALTGGIFSLAASAAMILSTAPVKDEDATRALQVGSATTLVAGLGMVIGAGLLEGGRAGLENESRQAVREAAAITDLAEELAAEDEEAKQAKADLRQRIKEAFESCLNGAAESAAPKPSAPKQATAVAHDQAHTLPETERAPVVPTTPAPTKAPQP